jgi:hypothetical protein
MFLSLKVRRGRYKQTHTTKPLHYPIYFPYISPPVPSPRRANANATPHLASPRLAVERPENPSKRHPAHPLYPSITRRTPTYVCTYVPSRAAHAHAHAQAGKNVIEHLDAMASPSRSPGPHSTHSTHSHSEPCSPRTQWPATALLSPACLPSLGALSGFTELRHFLLATCYLLLATDDRLQRR